MRFSPGAQASPPAPLANVYTRPAGDDPAVAELSVYTIGDGADVSGILLAARRAVAGETVMVVFLLDYCYFCAV